MMGLSLLAMAGIVPGDQLNGLLASIGMGLGLGPAPSSNSSGPLPPAHGACDYVFGIRGLADFLGVSEPTAQKLKNSGKIDSAIRKVGRKFAFDKQELNRILKYSK